MLNTKLNIQLNMLTMHNFEKFRRHDIDSDPHVNVHQWVESTLYV